MRIASVTLLGLAWARPEDVEALNLAITMENAKSVFYQEYSGALGGNAMRRLISNSNDFITVLSRAVQAMGGTPLQRCTYNFQAYPTTHSTTNHALLLARSFETATLQVYNSLQKALTNPKLREVVSAMATSQATHKAYLNSLARMDPLTESFESTMSPRQGLSFFKRYTASCPFSVMGGTFQLLTLRPDMGGAGTRVLGGIIASRPIRSAIPSMNSTEAVLDLRALLSEETAPDSDPDSGPDSDPRSEDNSSLAFDGLDRSGDSSEDQQDKDGASRYPEYCAFVVGNRQKFSEYSGGCLVPQGLPSGLAFVYIVREQARVSSSKNDHILAGPAIYDILGHSPYQALDESGDSPFAEGFSVGPDSS